MIVRLARHDGIRTVNVVRRRESVVGLERLGADAVIVSTNGPIDGQVRSIVGPQGVKYAVDPVVGETGTQMFKALHKEGRMLVYGSLTGEPIRMGEDPRHILAGRRILEVFWLGYWLPRLHETTRRKLVQDIVALMREGILETSLGVNIPSMRSAQPSHKQNQWAGRERYSSFPGPRARDDDANRATRPAARSRVSHCSGRRPLDSNRAGLCAASGA